MILASLIALLGKAAHAGEFSFEALSQQDFENVTKEFSANNRFTSISAAEALGDIFGFEVGVLGGLTQTDEINTLVKRSDPSAEVERIYHAGLYGLISVPYGITAEAMFVPTLKFADTEYQQFAGALKWTFLDPTLFPVAAAVRAHYSKGSLSFAQVINNASTGGNPVNVDVDLENKVFGVEVIVSPSLPVLKPYAGVGFLSGQGDIGIEGSTSASFFENTATQSASAKKSSAIFFTGLHVNLLGLNLGAEYSRSFSANRVSAKLGFGF